MEQTLISSTVLMQQTEVYLLSKPKKPILPINSLSLLNYKLWGLNKGRVVIVAGRTAMGKTAIMTQIAADLASNKDKVIYLSLEMPVKELIARNFSRKYKIDNYEIERGNFDTHIDKFKEYSLSCTEHKIKYSEAIGLNWQEIDALIKKMEFSKPDCIIIDHINHIKTTGINDKATIDDYLINIKAMAQKHNITFIIGAQINRLGQSDKNPMPELHHLKGTGRLEEVADLCLLLFWPYYYDNSKPREDYKIIVAKNRYGSTGMHDCNFYPQYSLFTESQQQVVKKKKEDQVDWQDDT